ncbi:MAG: hypothetical protein ACE37H_11565 [Phycisphaeraceae bacterium]
MDRQTSATLRVCILYQDGEYLAQCVDYDISAAGQTVDLALDEFVRTYMKFCLVAHELGVEPLADVPPAPMEYLERWRRDTQNGRRGVRRRDIPAFEIVRQDRHTSEARFGRLEASLPLDFAA